MDFMKMYFVAWKKHGEFQHLLDGPFIELERACDSLNQFQQAELVRDGTTSGHYILVVVVSMPITSIREI